MSEFYFVSPNTFLTLPPVKQLYKYFKECFEIGVIQSSILDYEDFFEVEKQYATVNTYRDYAAYHKQSSFEKLRKTVKFLFLYSKNRFFAAKKNEKRIVYTYELFALFVALLFKRKREFIIYHQFEVLGNSLNYIDRFSFWYVKRNFLKVGLVIFPERNRADLFIENIKNYSNNQLFILPNTNNNVTLSILNSANEKTIVTHIGSVGVNHHIDTFLKAISQLDASQYEVRFIGRLTKENIQLIQKYNFNNNVKIIGQVKHNELKAYYLETDIGIILYKDTALNYRFCAPNKLYEYWSYGIPVIGDQLPGLISVFTHKNLGSIVNMDDPQEIANAIEKTSSNGINRKMIQEYFKKNFLLDNYLSQLDQKLESL